MCFKGYQEKCEQKLNKMNVKLNETKRSKLLRFAQMEFHRLIKKVHNYITDY